MADRLSICPHVSTFGLRQLSFLLSETWSPWVLVLDSPVRGSGGLQDPGSDSIPASQLWRGAGNSGPGNAKA